MVASAQVHSADEINAPNLKNGAICLVVNVKSWSVAKFVCYIEASEVELLRDKDGRVVGRPIQRAELSDSNPINVAKLFAKLDVYGRSFQTKEEAQAFGAKAKFEEGRWINNIIREPSQLITLLGDQPRSDTKR